MGNGGTSGLSIGSTGTVEFDNAIIVSEILTHTNVLTLGARLDLSTHRLVGNGGTLGARVAATGAVTTDGALTTGGALITAGTITAGGALDLGTYALPLNRGKAPPRLRSPASGRGQHQLHRHAELRR